MHHGTRTFLPLVALALGPMLATTASASYVQVNLVSDGTVAGTITDPNLVNPWGIASSSSSPLWVADNGTGVSTIYNGAGQPLPLVVTIPPPGGGVGPSAPTGIVFNTTSGFLLGNGSSALFLFATENGTIAGWNGGLGTTAELKVDNSAAGAVYKGLALATAGANSYLYAANFTGGTVDVFDSSFTATTLAGNFTDPNLPAGYVPFNIQNLAGQLYVAYALQDPTDPEEELPGPGLGIVDAYDANGSLIRRIATGGTLNAPWGLALAPPDFGEFSNALLVGNFGDGRINAFDAVTDVFLGQLTDPAGSPISIEGLWGLRFGNNGLGGRSNQLFFAAGIDDETHGLFGRLQAVPEPGTFAMLMFGMVVLGARRRLNSQR